MTQTEIFESATRSSTEGPPLPWPVVGEPVLPVGARALPPWQRAKLLRIYRFAALLQASAAPPEGNHRAAAGTLLDALEEDVERMLAGHRSGHKVVDALRRYRSDWPAWAFRHLLAGARQDQLGSCYLDYEGLLSYCDLSGGSLGVLTLHALQRSPKQEQLDRVAAVYTSSRLLAICASVGLDSEDGRIYLPIDELQIQGASTSDLTGELRRVAAPVSRLVEAVSDRAIYMLQAAAAVTRDLPPAPRLAVSGVVSEAVALHQEMFRTGFDVLQPPPQVSTREAARGLLRAMRPPSHPEWPPRGRPR
ncbi:MAG: squalene/phytoene synthase family protein [Mycobacterium sp.]|nr:squalene/phytoene synthase family protein [Mycobacterium sp.]